MANRTDVPDSIAYSSTVKKVYMIGPDGNPVSDSNPLPVVMSASSSAAYESASLQPGTSANGYDVDTTGGMFSTVTTSVETIIKNRTGNSGTVTAYLNTDNVNPIVLAAGESIVIDKVQVTNIYLDTDAAFGAAEYVDIVLFG